jgi:RimJ/RimL family protein N-acetyltransferase
VIPTLTTPRLILRPPTYADYPAYAAFLASPRSTFMGGPFSGWAAWGMFCHDVGQWQLFGHGALMIDLCETGACIGQVGINSGPQFPEQELGWLLYDGHEGHGYATEAAAALHRWAFDIRKLPTLVSYFDPANAASMAVAARLGAARDDAAIRQDPEDVVYRHQPVLPANLNLA